MNINELFDPMFDVMANHIELTKDDNDMRYEYWRMMSSSNWANRDFEKLVTEGLDFLVLESERYADNEPLERVLPDVAERWVLMDISDWAVSDREISRMLPPATLTMCRRSADSLAAIKRDIEDMRRPADRGRGRGREPVGRGRDDRGLLDRGGRGGGRSAGRDVGARTNAFAQSRGRAEPERARSSGLAAAMESKVSGDRGGSPRERVNLLDDRDDEGRYEPVNAPRRGAVSEAVETAVRGGRTAAPARSKIDGPDFTLARPFDEFWVGNELWTPAYKSKWTLTETQPGVPAFETAYNPRKKIRFYVKDNNETIREELKDMSQEMEYLRHELTSQHRVRTTDDTNPKYTPTEKPGYVAPQSLPDETNAVIQGARSVTLLNPQVVVVSSAEEGELNAVYMHQKNPGKHTSVFNYIIATPIIALNLEGIDKLREVGQAINLTDAAQRLSNCVDQVDSGVWEFVNQRMTKAVNSILKNHYGIKVRLDDFAADYEKLIVWMKTKKDDQLARNFSLATRWVPAGVCAELDDDLCREQTIGTLNLTEEEYEAQQPPVMFFETYRTAILVNFTVGDMGLKLTETSQMLDELEYPTLHTLLSKAKACNPDMSTSSTQYLLTRDHYRVEVISSPYEQGRFMLRLMDV